MALTVTLANLRALCRLDAEIPDSITDTELDLWINQAARELTAYVYDLNPKWGITSDTINLTGTETYALPTDFYKMRDCYLGSPPSGRRLHEIPISQRYLYLTSITDYYGVYYLRGDTNISILPTGMTGTLTVFYVPTLADMTGPTDTFNGHFGWEEYLCNRVGLRFMKRYNDDTAPWERDQERIERRIASQIATQNLAEPRRLRNVEYERLAEQDMLLWK